MLSTLRRYKLTRLLMLNSLALPPVEYCRGTMAEKFKKTCGRTGYRPVLWIEEMDTLNFTEINLKWLHTLVDSVYSMDGCIIATTNKTHKQLVAELGEGIMGRIDGSREGGEPAHLPRLYSHEKESVACHDARFWDSRLVGTVVVGRVPEAHLADDREHLKPGCP